MATIIIAIDESKFARFAFKWYAENLHKAEYRVILYHGVENLFMKEMSPGRFSEFNKRAEDKAVKLNEMYSQLAQELQINAEIKIERVERKPEHAIIDMLDKEKPKCIVTGTRGMGVIRRTILGSFSDFVLRHARCPVVVCKLDED